MTGIWCIMFSLVGLCSKVMHIVTFSHQPCFNYMFSPLNTYETEYTNSHFLES